MNIPELLRHILDLEAKATPGPIRIGTVPMMCERLQNDPGDKHWSVFGNRIGCFAHFRTREEAQLFVTMRNNIRAIGEHALALDEENKALREALEELVERFSGVAYVTSEGTIVDPVAKGRLALSSKEVAS